MHFHYEPLSCTYHSLVGIFPLPLHVGAVAEVKKLGRPVKAVEQYHLGMKTTVTRFKNQTAAALANSMDQESFGLCVSGMFTQAEGWGGKTPGSGGTDGVAVAAASSRGFTKAKQDGPGNAIE